MTCTNVFSSDLISRAVDDDDDEEILDEENGDSDLTGFSPVLKWSASEKDIKCSSLLIAVGPAATGFVQVYLLECQKTEIVGVLCSESNDIDINTLGQRPATDKASYVYQILGHPDVLVVQCQTDVSSEHTFAWTEQLLKNSITQEDSTVTLLNSSSVNEFKSALPPGDLPRAFLRALKTTEFKEMPACTILEQPNMVAGLPAQILTYCQVHRIPCVMYVCFLDTLDFGVQCMKEFHKILQKSSFKRVIVENPKANEQLAKIASTHSKQNNYLYI